MAKFTVGSLLFGLMTLIALFGIGSLRGAGASVVPPTLLDDLKVDNEGSGSGELVLLEKRTPPYPNFPDSPPSCPICAQNYADIDGCAQACPVLANFSMVIFNPGAFIDVIRCACTDTFKAVFPQCVDCFIQTNQTDVIETDNLPAVLSGVQKICSLGSAVFGNVSEQDGEAPSISPTPTPTPTPNPNAASRNVLTLQAGFTPSVVMTLAVLVLGIAGVY